MGPAALDHARLIKIDSEHFTIRFLVPVLSIVLVAFVHLAGTAVLDDSIEGAQPACVMLPVDLLVLLAGGYAIERVLKRAMPSRRRAVLSDSTLTMTDARYHPPDEVTLHWAQTVNVKAWRFEIGRRARVPKGWYCMALYLLQDEKEMILYTFMSPDEAETVIGYPLFTRLRPRKETESNTDLSAVAEQRRLLKLEDARWRDGAEIARQDFHALLATLQRRVPGWY